MKEYGSLILLQHDLDLTLGVECHSVKDYQSSMKEEVWKRMKGCRIGPMSWPVVLWVSGLDGQGLRPNGLGRLVARFCTTTIFLAFSSYITTAN